MKIVLCCRVYPTHRPGGMPFVCRDRASALVAHGEEAHVLTTGLSGYPRETQVHGVMLHHLKCTSGEYSTEFATECEALCKKLNPDIIHLDSFDVNRLWWQSFNCKKAVTLHGFSCGAFLTQWNLYRLGKTAKPPLFNADGMKKEAAALGKFDTVIGVSKHEYWMLRDMFGLEQAKLVYNPIAKIFFTTPQVQPPTQKRFLCAAISGQSERLFAIAQEAAKEAGVEFVTVSSKSREEMPAVYDGVSALVVPTAYAQGYDLTVAEALARRRPVIASATGSYLREADITPYITLVKMGDKSSLQRAIQQDQVAVPDWAADKHRPNVHAQLWMETICG